MATTKWKPAGSLSTKEKGADKPVTVLASESYVVIGFEVNFPEAFKDQIHSLEVDYGHAFFYTVKESKVTKMFSFGPNGSGKVSSFNPLKDGYKNSRPGTPDYPITEATKLFRIMLNSTQIAKLETETDKARKKITDGVQRYSALVNDTCAETAREVLSAANISTPSAQGKVAASSASIPKPVRTENFPYVTTKNEDVRIVVASADNPYMWHHNFKAGGYKEVSHPVHRWKDVVTQVDPMAALW